MTLQYAAPGQLEGAVRSRPGDIRGFAAAILFAVIVHALTSGPVAADPVSLQAQADTDWIGKRVVQKRRDFFLRVDPTKKAVEQSEDEIHVYRVTKTDGPSIWLDSETGGLSGWAPADHVIPVDLAVAFFTGQMRDHPKDSFPVLMRAAVWHDKKELGRAMEDYNEAIRLDPQNAALHCNRGYLWGEQNKFDKAIADFTDAIRLDPHDAVAYLHRGHAWSELHQYDKAINDFTETIRLNSQDAYVFRSRGHAWLDKGDTNKATDDFSEAIRLDPREITAYINRGAIWEQRRDYDKALADYDHAMRLDPRDTYAHNARAWIWATCFDARYRDGAKALESAKKVCDLTEWKHPGFLDTLAAAYAEAGDFENAIKWQTKAIELLTDHAEKVELQARLQLYRDRKPYHQKVP